MSRFLLSILLLPLFCFAKEYNIGLCMMATGRYDVFAKEFIASCRKHFFKGHNVTYFVFSDTNLEFEDDVVVVPQERLGWPHDTLKRFHTYLKHKELFANLDYIFASDADMLFVADVGEEMLGARIGTQHPGFVNKRGSYETSPKSTAYVKKSEGKFYFAGGYYGGTRSEFIKLLETTVKKVDRDLKRGVIAVWHDESHLNRYFIDHPPTRILSPSYCMPERKKKWFTNQHAYPPKLIALDKDHAKLRKV
ncbi:MAG: hypothetical protein SNF33_04150 [Candidatus Algichlamydia australiensis]|nr:hypothetical protein [Chlamydiales bacterium]